MDVASAVIAFGQATTLCIQLGKDLVRKYQIYKSATKDVEDLVVRIEGAWLRIEAQIGFLTNILDSIDNALLAYQNACLERLLRQLSLAMMEVGHLIDKNSGMGALPDLSLRMKPNKKARYVWLSKHLQKLVSDLALWRDEFDPSWYLIGRIADSNIDKVLQSGPHVQGMGDEISTVRAIRKTIEECKTGKDISSSVFRAGDFVSPCQTHIIHSSIATSTLVGDKSLILLDQTSFEEDNDRTRCTTHVRDLARLLSLSKPETLGLLECLGVIKIYDKHMAISQYQFIFRVPPNLSNPSALRTLLIGRACSLDARFHIAKSLARSVMAVHSADLVHKSIRPETIVLLQDSPLSLPSSFLVGFERFRPVGAGTTLTGDNMWQRNIYRYPNRQGIKPEDVYIMQHDIYSLGVCLLELGLWTSFVIPTDSPQPGPQLDIHEQLILAENEPLQAAWAIKGILIDMAKESLPATMGLVYTEVVSSCLTCLDSGASNLFANAKDIYDQDGIIVGVTFIEKILLRLESIRM